MSPETTTNASSITKYISSFVVPFTLSIYPSYKCYQVAKYALDDSDDNNTSGDDEFNNTMHSVSIGFGGLTSLAITLQFLKLIRILKSKGYTESSIAKILCLTVALPIIAEAYKPGKKLLTSTDISPILSKSIMTIAALAITIFSYHLSKRII
ncbi:MAG: hypothetical protein VX777_05515 [Chlamydiota bacterium]|nr:hypothetical protein [Chlamydiota bacterium]